ncbi:tyrosine-type recombinase/integrase [Micromonospora sp. M12]
MLRRRPTPHDLRHTHAAWLFSDRRMTPLAISRRLGHAQLSTTSEIYGDLMPEAEEAAVDALDDLLNDDQGQEPQS